MENIHGTCSSFFFQAFHQPLKNLDELLKKIIAIALRALEFISKLFSVISMPSDLNAHHSAEPRPPSVSPPMTREELAHQENLLFDKFQDELAQERHFEAPVNVNLAALDTSRLHMCPGLGLLCAPFIGFYNVAGYEQAYPIAQIRLPYQQLKAFPAPIQTKLQDIAEEKREVYFVVVNAKHLKEKTHLNLCMHPVAFPNIGWQNANFMSQMGIFDPVNLCQPSPHISNLPFGAFQRLSINPHRAGNAMAMSPNNAKFYLDKTAEFSSFYAAATMPGGRGAAVYALLLHENDEEADLGFSNLFEQTKLQSFVDNAGGLHLPETEKKKIQDLLTFQRIYTGNAEENAD